MGTTLLGLEHTLDVQELSHLDWKPEKQYFYISLVEFNVLFKAKDIVLKCMKT